uniref:Uncharacterized protein n=1 Tax=Anabas testudineus TaxID=64144 RepID=A0A3Q1JHR7_ANATE
MDLSLCVCVSSTGTFVVNVTQTSYQAEENHNITLEWTFTIRPHTSSNSVNIFCDMFTDHSHLVLFHLHEGVEVSESQDQQFSGRVQFDKDVLREGRIRLQLSRLRTNDSGLYLCEMKTDQGWSSDRCRLNVTGELILIELNSSSSKILRFKIYRDKNTKEAKNQQTFRFSVNKEFVISTNLKSCDSADQHKPQRPTVSPPAEGPERIYLYTGLGLLLTAAALLTVINQKCLRKK